MPKNSVRLIDAFMIAILLVSVIHIGCSSRHLEQNPVERYYEESAPAHSLEQSKKNATEQSQKTVTSAKPKAMSIFTVIELEDLEHPTLATSIQLPYRVGTNNSVILSGEHAYLTTEKHLHVIDVSIPQRPSYLTSLAFPDKIGKVLAADDSLVVASEKKFYLVDVSQPLHPALESTGHLPQRNAIKDFDVLNDHLYVMGENDHLYIFYAPRGQARLVKAVELEKRWWLLSLKADGIGVKQVPQWTSNTFPTDLWAPDQRRFLQLHSIKQEKVRASSIFVVVEPTYDLLSFNVYRVDDHQVTSYTSHHNLEWQFREYLTATGQKTLTRRIPTRAYAVANGKMQEILPELSSETMDVEDKRLKQLMGPVTDFQISGDRLYIVTANGFFSITTIVHPYIIEIENMRDIEIMKERLSKWATAKVLSASLPPLLSATPLQTSRPISLAVGKGFAYVLATPEDSK
ncbi:hypothetical protein J5I95_08430 [Candidatus Poribacteria bacterium]|nr:hypothetical protein [Candidatus Poribacteria bacterium]